MSPQRAPARGRRLAFRVFAVLLAGIAALGLLEIALRVGFAIPYREFLRFVPDGRIGGRAEPGQVIRNTAGAEVRINRFGFRGPEWTLEPPPGRLRLLALGGSSTFGYESGEQATWPARCQERLERELGLPVEVVNLGLPGYDATHSKVNYLFFGRELRPHAILVYHTWNDMKHFRDVDAGRPDAFAPTTSNKSWWKLVARESQLARRARVALRRRHERYVENRYTSLELAGERANQPPGPAAWGWFERNFRDLARFARADGVLPVLVGEATIAQPVNLERDEFRERFNNDLQGMTAPVLVAAWLEADRVLARVAREESAIFIDGRAAVPPDFEHFADHVHLTERGNERLGQAIAEALLREPAFQELARRVRSTRDSGVPPAAE